MTPAQFTQKWASDLTEDNRKEHLMDLMGMLYDAAEKGWEAATDYWVLNTTPDKQTFLEQLKPVKS